MLPPGTQKEQGAGENEDGERANEDLLGGFQPEGKTPSRA